MNPPPATIGEAKVICFTPIDQRHRSTGKCQKIVNGQLIGAFSGLAVCQYPRDPGYYLFYCDARWHEITDTYHDTVAAAKRQAEFEYAGSIETWNPVVV